MSLPLDHPHIKHASPGMTGHYAKVHDAAIREAFDRYQSQRVNISGERCSRSLKTRM